VTIEVVGHPYSQGSKRPFVHRHTGRVIMVESAGDELRQYRAQLSNTMRRAVENLGPMPFWPQKVPVMVDVWFYFRRPAGHYGTGKNAYVLRPSAPLAPAVAPDEDKLSRAVKDSGKGIWWWNDSQVVDCHTHKRYALIGEDERTIVRAWQFTAWSMPRKVGDDDRLS
jgi:Holliday junction resolvase RusA-like endonuclease